MSEGAPRGPLVLSDRVIGIELGEREGREFPTRFESFGDKPGAYYLEINTKDVDVAPRDADGVENVCIVLNEDLDTLRKVAGKGAVRDVSLAVAAKVVPLMVASDCLGELCSWVLARLSDPIVRERLTAEPPPGSLRELALRVARIAVGSNEDKSEEEIVEAWFEFEQEGRRDRMTSIQEVLRVSSAMGG